MYLDAQLLFLSSLGQILLVNLALVLFFYLPPVYSKDTCRTVYSIQYCIL